MTFNLLTKNTTLTGLTSSSDGVNKQPVGVFNFMEEIWKDIKNYEGYYKVSNRGNVKSLVRFGNKKKKLLKPCIGSHGYYVVNLSVNGVTKNVCIHKLVAQSFIPEVFGKTFVNHKNGIKSDNRVENLEWVTNSENAFHANETGLCNNRLGNNPIAKPCYSFDKNGILLKKFESSKEASLYYGVNYLIACRIAAKTRKNKYINGITFSYEELFD